MDMGHACLSPCLPGRETAPARSVLCPAHVLEFGLRKKKMAQLPAQRYSVVPFLMPFGLHPSLHPSLTTADGHPYSPPEVWPAPSLCLMSKAWPTPAIAMHRAPRPAGPSPMFLFSYSFSWSSPTHPTPPHPWVKFLVCMICFPSLNAHSSWVLLPPHIAPISIRPCYGCLLCVH